MTAVVVEVDAHEGPVYVPDEDALYFTSVPAPGVAIKRLSLPSGEVSVLRVDANAANGMALHPDGRLLVCEQGTLSSLARISLVDRATGAAETVVDGWGGLPLNSPNDDREGPQHDVPDLEPAAHGADAQGRGRHPGPWQPALGVGRGLSLRLRQPRLPLTHAIGAAPPTRNRAGSSRGSRAARSLRA